MAVVQRRLAEVKMRACSVAGTMEEPVVKMVVVVVGLEEKTAVQMLVSVRLMRVTALVGIMEVEVGKMEVVVGKMEVVVGVLVAGVGMLGA